ncbi:hypothetical protein [Bdellovibrio svalbardensis]|uniref:Uncharacterized protein n=1 Tax=Bdellovibrio svalbardensis TaxID=2972972 RepID=A0ABT6DGA1_9BACT|nr:hypothetical protein [Bdellovibrio svalbardensis]MDG0815833.1 hypothetical protein [Bdellovibrio svalbardensis]
MIAAFFISNLVFAQATTSLDGLYQRPCFVADTDALTTEISIEKNQWKIQHIAYEDEKCEKAYLIYEVDYKVKSENNRDLDMTAIEVSYMTLSDEVSQALNMVHYCGFEDWKTKTKKIVTGRVCDEFQAPASGDILYSIFTLNQKADAKWELFLGTASATGDGKTPETRHDQVDSLPFLKLK